REYLQREIDGPQGYPGFHVGQGRVVMSVTQASWWDTM
ncbi:MAG: hypothetical protein ACI9SE_004477, partial [Neolewinella sp.]